MGGGEGGEEGRLLCGGDLLGGVLMRDREDTR